jgi:hypothetical protein
MVEVAGKAVKVIKVVGIVGAVASAYGGFNAAKADGAPLSAQIAVAGVEAVNPLPWSTIEIKNGIGHAVDDARSVTDAVNEVDVNNTNGHGSGLPPSYSPMLDARNR